MGDYTLDTTLMLKVLSRLAPQQAWTSDWLTANVIDEFLELFDVTQFLSEVSKNESIKTGVLAE
jgi:hypothetical protein